MTTYILLLIGACASLDMFSVALKEHNIILAIVYGTVMAYLWLLNIYLAVKTF